MPSFLPIIFFVLSLVFLFWVVYKREGITNAILQVLPFIFFTIALETGTKDFFYIAVTIWLITTTILFIKARNVKKNL